MAEDKQTITIRNARLSFPHLFKPQENKNDDGTVRLTYNCALMLKKGTEDTKKNLAAIKAASKAAKEQQWGSNPDKWPSIPSHKLCLRDGDNPDHYDPKKRPEYEGHYILSLNADEERPPQIKTNRKDSDNKWIDAEPGQKGAPYAGCDVNAVVRLWAQDNKHGVRINGEPKVVQFRADNEAFSQAAPVKAEDYLDDDDVSYEGDMDGDYGDDDNLI